jgi:tetratricopeptide (TPR) repeat protein
MILLLKKFLLTIKNGEHAIEQLRQKLAKQKRFEPHAAFQRIDRDQDGKITSVDLRLHLARLENVLGEHEDADDLYEGVIDQFPGEYEYLRLKGLNLIDWGKSGERDRFEEAYTLFEEAFIEKPRRADPLIYMLDIQIFRGRREDTLESVDTLYQTLNTSFPQTVHEDVFTRLALYYLDRERFEDIRSILLSVLEENPTHPPAHYAFAEYYRLIGDQSMQEGFLNEAIRREDRDSIVTAQLSKAVLARYQLVKNSAPSSS